MRPTQPPTETGLFRDEPFAHWLVRALDGRFSGALCIEPPGGPTSVVQLKRGIARRCRSDDRFALLGEVLVNAGVIKVAEVERALCDPGMLGEGLLALKLIDERVLEWALARQLIVRMARIFGYPPETTFTFYDGLDAFLGEPGKAPRVDPLQILWVGLRSHAEASMRMAQVMARIGHASFRVRSDADVRRFGFSGDSVSLVEALQRERLNLPQLIARQLAAEPLCRALVYTLSISRYLDVAPVAEIFDEDSTDSGPDLPLPERTGDTPRQGELFNAGRGRPAHRPPAPTPRGQRVAYPSQAWDRPGEQSQAERTPRSPPRSPAVEPRTARSSERPSQGDERALRASERPSSSDERARRASERPSSSDERTLRSSERPSPGEERALRPSERPSARDEKPATASPRSPRAHQSYDSGRARAAALAAERGAAGGERTVRTPGVDEPATRPSSERPAAPEDATKRRPPRAQSPEERAAGKSDRPEGEDRSARASEERLVRAPDKVAGDERPSRPSERPSDGQAVRGSDRPAERPSASGERTAPSSQHPEDGPASDRAAAPSDAGSGEGVLPSTESPATPNKRVAKIKLRRMAVRKGAPAAGSREGAGGRPGAPVSPPSFDEVATRVAQLEDEGPFDLLDLDQDCLLGRGEAEVADILLAAYEECSRRWDTRLYPDELAEMRVAVGRVHRAMRDAFLELSDPARRVAARARALALFEDEDAVASSRPRPIVGDEVGGEAASAPPALFARALAAFQGGQPAEALGFCERACTGDPENPDYAATAAWLRAHQADADVGVITLDLDDVLNAYPDHIPARYYRALLRDRLGDRGEARRDLERILLLDANHADARRKLAEWRDVSTTHPSRRR